ncbi:MAG TPA: DNA adenine methylase [Tahibacter sp.]|uniref:DNA adenine methylase n=1 Tax=Tahibacter sp. TaxID=2056211 RepID=UPI002B6FF74D|nr:DNA adenine methylase [Tahibacter sp.]HSX62242.1 DNA adenine methylase [Tahibacter sp.]
MTAPLFAWPGGKRRLLKHLLPLVENVDHSCYVEAFAGGAAVLLARTAPAKAEVLNDVNRDLVTLYRVVANHLDEFVRQYRWALTSREMFRWAQLQHIDTLTDVQRAARFYYLQTLAFGGKVSGRSFGTSTTAGSRLNLLRIEEELSAVHLRLARVTIECLPWRECVERYDRPHTLFFLDPPYWQTQGYGVPFPWSEYEQLAEVMRSLKGNAVLTINDHVDVRRLFRGLRMSTVAINYTPGGAHRAKSAGELIIRSG